jgi:phosphatidate phosphatase APP1
MTLLVFSSLQAEIKPDEDLIFHDTYIFHGPDGMARMNVRGFVFEPETGSLGRKILLKELRDIFNLDYGSPEAQIFNSRARRFMVDNKGGKAITLCVGEKIITLSESDSDGCFSGSVSLTAEELKPLLKDDMLTYTASSRDGRVFTGRACFIEAKGISVISDIDDTIKISDVLNRKELVKNTFIRPYRDVPGMKDLYSQWASRGYAFHYVSGSPMQLYEPLREFLAEKGFPETSIHLKSFRMKTSGIIEFLRSSQIEYKTGVIESILRDFPERKFILVGDSGEQDPEVYAWICARHEGQIIGIFIRDADNPKDSARRYTGLFGRLKISCRIFSDPAELKKFQFR